jgi:DNA polymerase
VKIKTASQSNLLTQIIDRQWSDCNRCPLGETAFSHVLYEIPNPDEPVHVLFVGEAPGASEDTLGRPFIGEAGRLLRAAIAAADPSGIHWGLSNVLACRPPANRDPLPREQAACAGRLRSLIEITQPVAVVALGRIASEWFQEYGRFHSPDAMHAEGIAWSGSIFPTKHPACLIHKYGPSWAGKREYIKYVSDLGHVFEYVRSEI